MKLAIGSDHSAFDLKQHLIAHLKSGGHEINDVGCFSKDAVDYPDIAAAVARSITSGQVSLGVMLDGAGVGSCIAANKIHGIRAALCNDLYTARNAREHNDANMLLMGSMVIGPGKASQILDLFVSSQFQGGRHQRRIDKLMALESPSQIAQNSADSSAIGDLVRKVLGAVQLNVQPSTTPVCSGMTASAPDGKPMLITEAWLREQQRLTPGVITIPTGALITPLAKDYIKDQHIRIESAS